MTTPQLPEVLHSLGMAMVAASHEPMLLMDHSLKIVAASASFCRTFKLAQSAIVGRTLPMLGDGEWAVPQLQSLLEATAAGHADIGAYEMDLTGKGRAVRHLVLNAQNLDYGDPDTVLLMLAISDITVAKNNARVKEELLHEKAILLQELQHRVANSLQIIASVLMQSARRVQSEESRAHLRDAHHRVMSVAAMQKQLAVYKDGEVALQPYFNELCRSIAASMIRDPAQLSLTCVADATVTSADISVSMGLIVTELVINALKHGFPNQAGGRIVVTFASHDGGWTLSVQDDGIGMPSNHDVTRGGLGTNIVAALASKLDAEVTVTNTDPGTIVEIVRSGHRTAHTPAL